MQIEGRNPVIEALKSEEKISVIYVQNKIVKSDRIREILSLAQKQGVRVRKIGKNKLEKMTRTDNHQGVIAKVKRQFKSLSEVLSQLFDKKKKPFFVIINEVLYEHNLGAIIRTAECAGCNGVIISKKANITENVVRTSMGATEHIAIIKENIFNAIKILKDNGIRIIGLEATGKRTLYQSNLCGAIALFIGGEHSGITRSFVKKCDDVLKIPLFGKIGSLNMSNAAAIALFEKVRQETQN